MSEQRAPYGTAVLNGDDTPETSPDVREQLRRWLDAEAASPEHAILLPSAAKSYLRAFMDALDRAEETIDRLNLAADFLAGDVAQITAAEHKLIRQRDNAHRLHAAHERLLRRHREKIRDFEALRTAVLGEEGFHPAVVNEIKCAAIANGLPEKALQRRTRKPA
jgi:hypothetical protein